MKTSVRFYHAGCPVCVAAEQGIADGLDASRYDLDIIHLSEQADQLAEAEQLGVKSVPALVISGQVFHINHGADLKDLK